ncbi:penicillin-binding transpeptidase domain-containing protein [Vibrio chagasii]|nr:penicillin-binding transpeptidase domain-containing protein [Vibrio chagasii]
MLVKTSYSTVILNCKSMCSNNLIIALAVLLSLDPDNSVLAMASSPSYDPNLFVDGISQRNYQTLLNDPAHPLVNRATLGVYPPASTVKPFMAVARLGRTCYF